jgi:DNA-binding NarL/FixJ family response regulator
MTRTKLVVADDDGVIRDALSALLARDYDVVALAGDGRELIDAVIAHRPDVVVADVDMPGVSGIDALHELQSRKVPIKIVFLTMHDDPRLAADVLRAGAAGYVLKHSASIELHDAIQLALAGGRYVTARVSSAVVQALVDAPASPHTLTPRQVDVLRLLAEGKRMKEVGAELNLSTRTVENYKYELMDVLGLHSTAEIVRYALSHGLLRK